MKRYVVVLVSLLSLTAVAASTEKDEAVTHEEEKLQGKWKAISVEIKGQQSPAPAGVEAFLLIKGNKWTIEVSTKAGEKPLVLGESTFQVDPTQMPKVIDLVDQERNEKVVNKCIYKLDKDTLTVCSANIGRTVDLSKQRPSKFTSADGGTIRVFKRVER
jgi:uncharacterized protein (TIGR03067 family)